MARAVVAEAEEAVGAETERTLATDGRSCWIWPGALTMTTTTTKMMTKLTGLKAWMMIAKGSSTELLVLVAELVRRRPRRRRGVCHDLRARSSGKSLQSQALVH